MNWYIASFHKSVDSADLELVSVDSLQEELKPSP